MLKWLLALVVIAGLAFAAGLRIDLKVLQEKLQNKPDQNVAALLKMGINPDEVGYQSKPWWTFRSEDGLFSRFHFNLSFGGRSKTMLDTFKKVQGMKKTGQGLSPGGIVEDQARQAGVQARLAQARVEDQLRNLKKQ